MATDFILEIDGIKGESQDKKLKDMIEVDSFSWGVSNGGSHASGTGGGAGKANFQDIHFTSSVGKASPTLALSCANGKHISKAVLHVRKQGEDQQEYYTITLEDLLVSSYQSGDAAGGTTVPTDQFSLNFAKIKYEYKPQKKDGTLDAPVTMTWDLKKNAK
ncbi:MAG TPA: type VI secretion system tube protein Hcp [Bosea sp. (in: a-proteobacteria)]|jgi:type VI secretion system secreted protein Hcp|uniref:Hcp family type VI secretion system effector n=1 Tax=Bosea sp. (in: a-proteobacteria) TaxID=1871050 RepID=UPI002DDCBB3C|nr:type VI secretion system tube protein Hcp [Bosea sp. (in: a-proteobacteria)]HEV2555666.1 type VI secretion system tube protein Hcp [Bosea sp. (in: a-proteobacteria)]